MTSQIATFILAFCDDSKWKKVLLFFIAWRWCSIEMNFLPNCPIWEGAEKWDRYIYFIFLKSNHDQWAKTWEKIQFQKCVWVVARLPQILCEAQKPKSTFFEFFFLLYYESPPLEFFLKNVDFNLWGKECHALQNGLFPSF